MLNERLDFKKTTSDDLRVIKIEEKIEEIEDALDEFAKQVGGSFVKRLC